MGQFVASSSSQLLALMAIPAFFALLLFGFIIFSIRQRSKKSQMKHGSLGGLPAMNQLDNLSPIPTSSDSSTHKRPSAFSSDQQATDSELNLDILGNGLKISREKPTSSSIEPEIDRVTTQSSPQPSAAKPTEPEELLRLLRDPLSGQLIVQIGEQRYTKLADIADKKIGQFILKLAAHFLAFTGGMIVTDAGVKSVHNPKVSKIPEPVITQPSRSSQTAPAQTAPKIETPQPPIPKPPLPAEATLSSLTAPIPEPVSSRGLFGRSKPAATPSLLPMINLAKEINEIVQNRLIYSPLASNTKIEISSAIDGGIRINVNGAIYNSPDEVPDLEAKTLIKESIKQWERS